MRIAPLYGVENFHGMPGLFWHKKLRRGTNILVKKMIATIFATKIITNLFISNFFNV